jgi:phospholipase/lecithinase/hemolysin
MDELTVLLPAMYNQLIAFITGLSLQVAAPVGVAPGQIKNLVTFGDSYTDVDYVWDGGTRWLIFLD